MFSLFSSTVVFFFACNFSLSISKCLISFHEKNAIFLSLFENFFFVVKYFSRALLFRLPMSCELKFHSIHNMCKHLIFPCDLFSIHFSPHTTIVYYTKQRMESRRKQHLNLKENMTPLLRTIFAWMGTHVLLAGIFLDFRKQGEQLQAIQTRADVVGFEFF